MIRVLIPLLLITLIKSWDCASPQDSIQFGPFSNRHLISRSSSLSPLRLSFIFYNLSTYDSSESSSNSLFSLLSSVQSFFSLSLKTYSISGTLLLSEINSCGSEVLIPEYHKTYGISDTDIAIYVTSNSLQGQSYMAYSGSCAVDQVTGAVYAGRIVINTQNYENSDISTRLSVLIHETTHILGFSSGLMKYWKKGGVSYLDSELTKTVTIRGATKTLLVTPNVVTHVRTLCATLDGAELEDQGGSGTIGSHWEMRTFYNEIMISHVMQDVVFSSVTLALLKDTGWYDANFTMGQSLNFAKNAGCSFFSDKCINAGVSNFANWFCSAAETSTCDYFALNKAYCNLATYTKDLSPEFQYFSSSKRGGSDMYMDYCSYRQPTTNGACRGSEFGTVVDASRMEKIGINSKCFISTLSSTGVAQSYSSVCYETSYCDSNKITLKIGSTSVDCLFDGSTITVSGYTGTIKCPTHNDICGDIPCKFLCSGLGACINGVCVCKSGYSGDYCNITCGSNCAQCSESACLVCNKANMVVSGKNCVCSTGFFISSGTCISSSTNCNTLCISCTSPPAAPSTKVCSQCADHASYDSSSNTCSCNAGYYDSGSGYCEKCADNCAICSSSVCTTCATNAQVDSSGICKCNSGYFSSSDICELCEVGCKTCSSASKCTGCLDGYFLQDDNCELCPSNCMTCDGLTTCLSCNSGFYLYKLSCIEDCPAGYYRTENICRQCAIAFCESCYVNGTCSSCQSGYSLSNEACFVSCPNNCESCTFSGFCSECSESFFLLKGQCFECSTGCLDCSSAVKCNKCKENYQLRSGSCVLACPSNCNKCSDVKTCISCMPGYYLDKSCVKCPSSCSICLNKEKCLSCAAGFSLSGQECEKKCPMNCSNCKGGTCFSCDLGWVLRYGKCYALCPNYCSTCDSFGKCLKCDKSYFLKSGFCKKCEEGCLDCQNSNLCTSCSEGLTLNNGFCV